MLRRLLVGTAITGALFVVLSRFVDWPQIAKLAKQARAGVLAAGLALYVVLYLVRAWRFVLLAPRTPFSVMLCITAVHNLMLRLMPMRTGELAYAYLVRRAGTAGMGESLLGLVLLRLLDATTIVVIFAVTLALNRTLYRGDSQLGLIISLLIAATGVVAVLAFGHALRLGVWISRSLARVTRLSRVPAVTRLIEKLQHAVESHARMSAGSMIRLSAVTILHWMLTFGIIFTVVRGFAIDVSLPQAILGGTAATVSGFLPIAGIGNFGALEAGWALGFALVGLPPPLAVASAFGFSMVTFGYALLLGASAWFALGRLSRRATRPAG